MWTRFPLSYAGPNTTCFLGTVPVISQLIGAMAVPSAVIRPPASADFAASSHQWFGKPHRRHYRPLRRSGYELSSAGLVESGRTLRIGTASGRRTRASVVQAQRQIHRVFAGPLHRRWSENAFSDRDCRTTMTVSCRCVAIRGSSPFIDCGFDARRTSHPVAVLRTAGTTIPHSGGHRAREGGSTLYVGISQPLFVTVRPPGSNGADQALVELAIMDALDPAKLRRPTRGRGQ